jgi:hypothetical protein
MSAGEPTEATTVKRASPFDIEDTDLALFAPKKGPNRAAPPQEAVLAVAEATKFPSREGRKRAPAAAPVAEMPKRKVRQHRTGRNRQFNVKATQETIDAFYEVTDREEWVLGETLENAIEALKYSLKQGWKPSKK